MKIIYLLILLPILCYSQSDWKLAKDKKGIQIWVRNYNDSPYKEYKAITYVQTTINNVVNELLDAPKYIENCEEGISHLVKVNHNSEYIFYARNELPWPIKDRDVVSKLNVQKISENKVKLYINAAPEEVPVLKNALRIRELSGYWLLEEKGEGIKITQQLYLNPEGSLPPFITNSLLISGPFKTFLTLRSQLKDTNS
ncbi:START domain-containing protein [Aquimarina sp. 2201CG5-10]|uniref:START domain-containing protein n=1 Tax=Aquimarina callyspongiae TaxID=3098150 RepID=UPI002AB57282|nr:START domain-containing protein [Aquimarina sp. 2201CG5-10]MDY8135118.1 START domain-containing protein [Aquimarina sp. 2201CG5-10]